MLHPNYGPSDAYSAEELNNLWAHYAAELELVDRCIGRVLQKIDDLELWDDTIVVVLSDHGMSIGEHGRTGKSNLHDDDRRFWPIYPEVGHSLLLLAGGDIPAGQSLDLLAQPIDLLPTMCELAGATVQPPVPLQGRSFARAVLAGESGHRDIVVSGCHIKAEGGLPPRKASTPFLVTREWGYAPVALGRPELYALPTDPLAEHNVAADHPEVVAQLHQAFLDYLEEHLAPAQCMALWQTVPSVNDMRPNGTWAIDYS